MFNVKLSPKFFRVLIVSRETESATKLAKWGIVDKICGIVEIFLKSLF